MTALALEQEIPLVAEAVLTEPVPEPLILEVSRQQRRLAVDGILGLPRKQLAKAVTARRTIVFDFSKVKNSNGIEDRKLRNLLFKMRGLNHAKSDAEATIVLRSLSEEMSQKLERIISGTLGNLSVSDREFAISVNTRTVYSPTVSFTITPWARQERMLHVFERLIARDGSDCAWCSRALSADERCATIDHVITRVAGGRDVIDNYLLACENCNRARSDCEAAVWLAECLGAGQRRPQVKVVEKALKRAAKVPLVSKPAKKDRAPRHQAAA